MNIMRSKANFHSPVCTMSLMNTPKQHTLYREGSEVSEPFRKQASESVNKQASNDFSTLDVPTVAPSQCSCALTTMAAHYLLAVQ